MIPETSFAGKTVLVTGGTRGIGAAVADLFAEAGATVLITGTRQDDVDKRVKTLRQLGSSLADGWAVDMKNADSFEIFRGEVRARDSLHVLVNNAGINKIVSVDEIEADDLDSIFSLNLRAPVLLTSDVASAMKKHGWGRIVNIASIWSVITKSGRSMYTASKFGLVGATKAAAADLAGHNILVNAVSPGFTLTELTRSTLSVDEMDALAADVPLRRFADPQEIARVVFFLASDWNTYITAQNIVVDGGFVSV